jgi:ATPase subunit of ABC transporter with duplicated ATPase domains
MTSHDREFLNRIVGRIIEIDGGVLTSYSGNHDFYEKQRAQNEAQAQAAYERQQAMLDKEMRFIERFKAQAAKASQVQSRVTKLDKIEKSAAQAARCSSSSFRPARARRGRRQIERLGKRYGKGSSTTD